MIIMFVDLNPQHENHRTQHQKHLLWATVNIKPNASWIGKLSLLSTNHPISVSK